MHIFSDIYMQQR